MAEEPQAGQNLHDRTGWVAVSCNDAEAIRSIQRVVPGSSLTDLSGSFGRPLLYTEWWVGGTTENIPVLRDYLWEPYTSAALCEHLVPESSLA